MEHKKPFRLDRHDGHDRPLRVDAVQVQTVAGLAAALQVLIDTGYGDTSIFRADIEAGWSRIGYLELYNTEAEKEGGELPESLTFLLC